MAASSVTRDASKINSVVAWLVCFGAAMFFFYSFIQMMMFNAVSPILYADFHANATQVGLLDSSYFYANVPSLLLAGLVLDRLSTRKVLLAAILVAVIGTFVFAFSEQIWTAATGRFLVGAACAFCFLGIVRLVSRWFSPNRMALVIGLSVTLAFFGGMIAQTPFSILTTHFGWRISMSLDGLLGLLIFWWMFVTLKDAPSGAAVKAQQAQIKAMGFWKSIKGVIKNPQNWYGGIYISATNLAVFVLGSAFGSLYLTQVSHFSTLMAGNIMMIFFLGLMIGSPFFGWVSDRYLNRKWPMLLAALLLLISFLMMLYWVQVAWYYMAITFFLMGFASGGQVVGFPMIAESNTPALTATAESLASALIMAGGIMPQWVGTLLQNNWDQTVLHHIPVYSLYDYRIAFSVLPIGAAIAIIAVLLSKETHAKNTCQ
jgi:MFS family permease